MSVAAGIDEHAVSGTLEKRFARDGYAVVRGLIPRRIVAEVGAFLEAYVDGAVAALSRTFGVSDRAELFARLAALQAGDRAGELDLQTMNVARGLFPLEIRMDERLRSIAFDPAVRAAVGALLGSDELRMHMPPTARHIANGNVAAPVPAHQDVSYNRHMSDFITMWTPFTAIDEACGGVGIYTGSNEPRERSTAQDGFWLGGIAADEAALIHPLLEPGDVLFLDKWIVHRSMPNRSERTRMSIDYRFFAPPHTSTKHYLDVTTRIVHAPAVTA
jgi:ectoine hydroxylase-related dioxygenase (phytanoyl-CoA dioxygenase family)